MQKIYTRTPTPGGEQSRRDEAGSAMSRESVGEFLQLPEETVISLSTEVPPVSLFLAVHRNARKQRDEVDKLFTTVQTGKA